MQTRYIPTKDELLDMGFNSNPTCDGQYSLWKKEIWNITIDFDSYKLIWRVSLRQILPTSKKEVETIIRLYTII